MNHQSTFSSPDTDDGSYVCAMSQDMEIDEGDTGPASTQSRYSDPPAKGHASGDPIDTHPPQLHAQISSERSIMDIRHLSLEGLQLASLKPTSATYQRNLTRLFTMGKNTETAGLNQDRYRFFLDYCKISAAIKMFDEPFQEFTRLVHEARALEGSESDGSLGHSAAIHTKEDVKTKAQVAFEMLNTSVEDVWGLEPLRQEDAVKFLPDDAPALKKRWVPMVKRLFEIQIVLGGIARRLDELDA